MSTHHGVENRRKTMRKSRRGPQGGQLWELCSKAMMAGHTGRRVFNKEAVLRPQEGRGLQEEGWRRRLPHTCYFSNLMQLKPKSGDLQRSES